MQLLLHALLTHKRIGKFCYHNLVPPLSKTKASERKEVKEESREEKEDKRKEEKKKNADKDYEKKGTPQETTLATVASLLLRNISVANELAYVVQFFLTLELGVASVGAASTDNVHFHGHNNLLSDLKRSRRF